VAIENTQPFAPFISDLLQTMLKSCKDPSYTVRNASCSTISHILSTFSEETKDLFEEAFGLLVSHLSENI
jgi:hypothetical protein